MPRKLTIIGVLAGLVLGMVGLAQNASGASPNPAADAQSFCTIGHGAAGSCPAGSNPIDITVCYDLGGGVPPSAIPGACGAGSSDSAIPAALGGGLPIKSWQVVSLPVGNRLTLPVSYLPGDWGTASVTATNPPSVSTGDVTSRTDVFCNASGTANIDILARNETNTPPEGKDPDANPHPVFGSAVWPGNGWDPYKFYRAQLADSNYAYIDSIKPMPATFTDVSLDVSRLVKIFLGGQAGFKIAPGLDQLVTDPNIQGTPLVNVNTLSPYNAGLHVTVAILGGSPNPPNNQYICLDSPQDSIATNIETLPPQANGGYVRWTNLQSAADLVSSQVTRLMFAKCLLVGTGVGSGTCQATAPNSGIPTNMGDADGDGVPDSVELVLGTNAAAADTDVDGATDFHENFEFTNPLNVDTDGDGSWDLHDDLTGLNCGNIINLTCVTVNNGDTPATGAGSDDNCPVDANPTQLNSDSLFDFSNSPNVPAGVIARTDATNPHQDRQGDVCDSDADNDGMDNVVEAGFNHPNQAPGCTGAGTWVGGAAAGCTAAGPAVGTLWCLAQGAGAPTGGQTIVSTNPLNPDSDSDGGLDGRECQFGSDPTSAGTGSCSSTTSGQSPTCIGLNRYPAAQSNDGDGDLLFPDLAEVFYRTSHISQGTGAALDDLEQGPSGINTYNCPPAQPACTAIPDTKIGPLDNDSDGDILNDGVEVKWYATQPSNFDTDGDGCSDGREAADVNGDHKVNSTDGLAIGQHGTAGSLAPSPIYNNVGVRRDELATYDVNKDGKIDSGDQLLVNKLTGNCKAGIGAQVSTPLVIGTKP